MTVQQYPSPDLTTVLEPKLPPEQKPTSPSTTPHKGRSLSQQLLRSLLPMALLPLAVASGLGILITRRGEREDALNLLKEESFLASKAASVFVENNFKTIEGVLLNPTIIQTLRQADSTVTAQDLDQEPVESLEQQFSQTKLINTDATLNQYLADVVEVEGMEEIFVTESHGLNAAYSQPTSDFVQRDEDWWTQAQQSKKHIEPVDFDESAGVVGISISEAVSPPGSDEFLGVIKAVIPLTVLNEQIATYVATAISGGQKIQVIDTRNDVAFSTLTADQIITDDFTVSGGEGVTALAEALSAQLARPEESIETLQQELAEQAAGKLVGLERLETLPGETFLTALLEYEGREYSLTTVPNTSWVAISSVDLAEINSAGRGLLIVFALTALVLGVAIFILLRQLAGRLSDPLQRLTATAQQATAGDLGTRASLQGTRETQILGEGFNNLLEQLQSLLSLQKAQTEEQRSQRETLENDITQLMEDVGDAADGDLSVRAKLSASDVGIVADLFNAIIENLRDIAINVKQSTGKVSQSLSTNEQQILTQADQAVEEAREMGSTMIAVEEMGRSIESVADSASQASALTNDTYTTVQAGSASMEQTAESILELRSTVGETAKKIKRLGESAQKISQAVSLIDSIALKTNLLAVNASVEAARAGELGQGFSAVAEQVGSLAEQSAGATKTIAQIVAEIQTETQEVVAAIETGTAQVVDSSNLVSITQQQLDEVLSKSEKINQLMQRISEATVGQTRSSTAVTDLIKKATQSSQQRSQTSAQMAQAIKETAKVAQSLQNSVEQFKILPE
ncbi:MAG: methyl-accepting chemotaxis protein [Phormidesmis sp.]